MAEITFITGNAHKAAYVAARLGHPIQHHALDLPEVQSLDIREIAEHKARQAFAQVGGPVLVEDTALEFSALGRLPGTFIKWFLQEIGNEGLCQLLDHTDNRSATARICFCLYDGRVATFFEEIAHGTIAGQPRGERGFGWDSIFIKEGMTQTKSRA